MTTASRMAFTLGRSNITPEACLEIVEKLGKARYDEVFQEWRKGREVSDDQAVNANQQIIRTLSSLAKNGQLDDSETQTYIDDSGIKRTRSKYKVPPKQLPYRPSPSEILREQLLETERQLRDLKKKYEATCSTIDVLEAKLKAMSRATND